jgi:hypothetical protein
VSDLQTIPGIGVKIEKRLNDVRVTSIEDMRKSDPEELFRDLCDIKASPVDRCVLYAFRCAKYFVSNEQYDSERLKWWNWKD